MPRSLVRARLLTLAAVLPLALAIQSRSAAQEPSLEVYYNRLEPKEQFKYKWKGKEGVCTAGVFRWEVPETQFGTSGLDRNFTGYCAEILVPITADKLYRFRVNSLYDVNNYDGLKELKDKDKAPLAAQQRAIYVRELFGRYFRDPVEKATNPDEAIALQVALWEVIQETQPAEGDPKFDLFAGDFQANYPPGEAPAFVKTAQSYLTSLTGNDAIFYENPALRGRELIRLMGIPNAENVVAQSQFALRYVGGGGPGNGTLASALTGGGGVGALGGLGGGFGGLGAAGGAGSGGGALLSGTPGGGTPTTTTTTPPTTPPVVVPPINGPPDTPGTPTPTQFGGGGGAVPAPPAIVLGGIALGMLGTWRLGARLLRK